SPHASVSSEPAAKGAAVNVNNEYQAGKLALKRAEGNLEARGKGLVGGTSEKKYRPQKRLCPLFGGHSLCDSLGRRLRGPQVRPTSSSQLSSWPSFSLSPCWLSRV